MKSRIRRWWLARLTVVGCTTLLLHPYVCPAAATFWSNSSGGNYTNTANWLGGIVPVTGDSANFTNNAGYSINWTSDVTNSNAYFNAQSGTVTLNVSPRTWSLLDTLTVGQIGATGSVTHTSGTIVITNAAGLGALVVGEAGRGTYTLGGGTVMADRLLVTNLTTAGTNSIFTFNGGTLTTLGGSEIRAGASLFTGALGLQVGNGATPANWNMLGGSNTVLANNLYVGLNSDNRILVSGPSTTFDFTGSIFWLGITGNANQLVISNGGRVNMTLSSQATLGFTGVGSIVTVTGSNSLWNLPTSELGIGRGAGQDQVIVTNGGEIRSANIRIGELAHSNIVTVTGTGSRWLMSGTMIVGYQGKSNVLYVSNGGVVSNGAMRVGQFDISTDNRVEVSGAGSLLVAPELHVGSNSASKGTGIVIIKDGGTLQSGSLVSGGLVGGAPSGVISNSGGIYQFTGNDPNVAATTPNSIVLNNGTISYRGINNASVFAQVSGSGFRLTNMTFQGNNAFRLNNASNATGVASYTFNTGLGATNYTQLQLVGNGSLWRSTTLNIGSGGSLLASNTVGTVAASMISSGTIQVVNSKMTFLNNVVLSGSYVSDPSTNTFLGNVTVTSSGTLAGGLGDRFEFGKSLYISNASNPSATFNLASSTVAFINGGRHTNAITGVDFGNDGTNGYPDGFTGVNFSYGSLTLGSTNDQVLFTKGGGAVSNALYVDWLDLGAFTSQFASVSNMVTSLLFAPTDINIYYMSSALEPGNAFLMDQVYRLDNGAGSPGGLLMPAVPEPTTMAMLGIATVLLLRRRQ